MMKESIFRGEVYPWVGGGWGELCEIFLTDPGYVAGEYELSRCVG